MAMSNAQRQAKWREKNRALFNLRRRNARKRLSLVEKEAERDTTVLRTEMSIGEKSGSAPHAEDGNSERLQDVHNVPNGGDQQIPPPRPSILDLRKLIAEESQKPPETSVESRPVVYRNDYGGVISKFAWEKLQKMKAHAKENNFEIDEYSQ